MISSEAAITRLAQIQFTFVIAITTYNVLFKRNKDFGRNLGICDRNYAEYTKRRVMSGLFPQNEAERVLPKMSNNTKNIDCINL